MTRDVRVTIGRTSGPITDNEATSLFPRSDVDAIADTIAMVNAVTRGEGWYYRIDNGPNIEPSANVSENT